KADSKYLYNDTAHFLYQVAAGAGVNVQSIEAAQKQKAEERQEKMSEKIQALKKRLDKLSNKKLEA
ncbi:MAG: hypothetical protein ABI480_13605, partial [Chitinophagaceae bacterium]